MRISDWSSDVCSSDLGWHRFTDANGGGLDAVRDAGIADYPPDIAVRKATRLRSRIVHRYSDADRALRVKSGAPAVIVARQNRSGRGDVRARIEHIVTGQTIGRASCRARVCQYV